MNDEEANDRVSMMIFVWVIVVSSCCITGSCALSRIADAIEHPKPVAAEVQK